MASSIGRPDPPRGQRCESARHARSHPPRMSPAAERGRHWTGGLRADQHDLAPTGGTDVNDRTAALHRTTLPIPDRRPTGPITYDAKDPETSFAPIVPLRPPAGAPN